MNIIPTPKSVHSLPKDADIMTFESSLKIGKAFLDAIDVFSGYVKKIYGINMSKDVKRLAS